MEKLKKLASKLNVSLDDSQLNQFNAYYELIIEKNKVMNLTAITEKDEVIMKHFVDSLAIVNIPEFNKCMASGGRLIDVGTGAGFPGIPLKIAFPSLEIVLLDSLMKRVHFLEEVIDTLGLTSITAIHGRAEEAAHDKGISVNMPLRGQFDIVTSRAVANLSALSEYSLPFVKAGGYYIPYKATDIDTELKDAKAAITKLGGKYIRTDRFTLPDSDIERSWIVVRKETASPKKYPRKAGDIKKSPLR